MIQRYTIHTHSGGISVPSDHGEYVRYADIEPLLPRWIDVRERLPSKAGQYTLLLTDGTISDDFWFADDLQTWDDYLPSEVSHYLDFELPPLPQPPKGTE